MISNISSIVASRNAEGDSNPRPLFDWKWRKRARFVGYIELILAIFRLVFLVYCATFITFIVADRNESGSPTWFPFHPSVEVSRELKSSMSSSAIGYTGAAVLICAGIGVGLGVVLLQFLATRKLLRATKYYRQEPRAALRRSRFWSKTNLWFISLYVIAFVAVFFNLLPVGSFIIVLVAFIIHIMFITLVDRYIKELEAGIAM